MGAAEEGRAGICICPTQLSRLKIRKKGTLFLTVAWLCSALCRLCLGWTVFHFNLNAHEHMHSSSTLARRFSRGACLFPIRSITSKSFNFLSQSLQTRQLDLVVVCNQITDPHLLVGHPNNANMQVSCVPSD